jgi:hypothetical protein
MDNVLHSFKYSLDFLEEQIAGVADADLVAQPGGIVNHPAWTIGHLGYVLQMIGMVIGIEGKLPPEWVRRYGSVSEPTADAEVYEGKDAALSILRESRDRIIEAVSKLDDSILDQPFPDPAYRDDFPTIRHALTQVLIGHTAFHVGQVSVWRRAMGLPALGRSYE